MTKDKNKRQCNYKVSSKTLDLRHQTQMEEFLKNKSQLELYQSELSDLRTKYKHLMEKDKKELNDEELQEMIYLKDRTNELEQLVDSISQNTDEIDYFINTGDVLFEYYSLLENSNNIGVNNSNKKTVTQNSNNKKKCVIDFFYNKGNTKDISINENNRAELLDKYLSYTDVNYIDNTINNIDATLCSHCEEDSLVFNVNESIYCCQNCNTIEKVITDNEKPSYKDPPKEISYFSYKRINHYTEWLNQIQGKETTEIPDEVFDNIMKELKKQRIYDSNDITREKIKDILKKLKINKYYEHVPYILNRITGNPNPHLSPELENKLKQMFKEIQVPFLKYSPLNRKNFLSYSYVIHKFIQLLGQTEYLSYFPLLKSREKLHQQEQIWKKICDDLGWEFIRSI